MYLHTGNGRIVFQQELIGIFKYDLFDGIPIENNRIIVHHNTEPSKTKRARNQSIIVTDREIFSAPIAPLTLAGRSNKN